jgi:molecular chaperone Hsp31 and glyoxalase 3
MNGTYFSTGHHTTEAFVPMYHFDKAGFKFDFATEDGLPLALEEWTFPMAVGYESNIREIHNKVKDQLEKPKKYEDIPEDLEGYAAIFIPGGHGPIIDMHEYESLGMLLRSANAKGITTISLCHGPSALRSAAVGGDFPYNGYNITVFPDSMDKMSPMFGYLPGYLSDEFHAGAKLVALGCNVQNKWMDDSFAVDRELVTGASQMAAQKVAEAAAKVLMGKFVFDMQ